MVSELFPEVARAGVVLRGPWPSRPPPSPPSVRSLAVELAGLCLCDAPGVIGSHFHLLDGSIIDAHDVYVCVTTDGNLGIRGTDTELSLRPPQALFTTDHYVTRSGRRRKVPIVKARANWRPATARPCPQSGQGHATS